MPPTPKKGSLKKDPTIKFKTSNNWADNYSLDTTGLSKGTSNYYPYKRSNGTKGVLTRSETNDVVKQFKKGKLKKSDWYKKIGGTVKAKKKK